MQWRPIVCCRQAQGNRHRLQPSMHLCRYHGWGRTGLYGARCGTACWGCSPLALQRCSCLGHEVQSWLHACASRCAAGMYPSHCELHCCRTRKDSWALTLENVHQKAYDRTGSDGDSCGGCRALRSSACQHQACFPWLACLELLQSCGYAA